MPTQIMANGETCIYGQSSSTVASCDTLDNPSVVHTSKRKKVPPFEQIPKNNEDIIKR